MDQKTRQVLKWFLQERGVQMIELILHKKNQNKETDSPDKQKKSPFF